MPPTTSRPMGSRGGRLLGLVLPVTIIGAILVFIVPIPAWLLDVLLSANLTVAVVVLLTTLAIRTPQEFSAFPTILLTTTLTRLVLNVATTRLVLTRGGQEGLNAAGGVIRAFGEFVAGNQLVVGVILFSILVVIQFVVITRGATRISEVAARFMLDGLPGRQMAIDADVHAGLIDQHEAHRLRDEVYRQADFFGAMDGAGKFVRGDAIAGVIILLVNISGGLFLGTVTHGMSVGEAVNVFTKLTIGDGLVSQVPAFLISLAAGLIVTRSSSSTDLSGDVVGQLFAQPGVLGTAAVFLGLMALTPLPKLPLLALGGSLGAGALLLISRRGDDERFDTRSDDQVAAMSSSQPRAQEVSMSSSGVRASAASLAEKLASDATAGPGDAGLDRMEDLLHVDPLELEIGFRLISLADPVRGGDLLGRLKTVRQRVARDMGLIVPQVRIHDEISLGPNEYRVKIRGTVVGLGVAYAGRLLAVPPAGLVTRPDGRDGVDPVSGQPAVWIHADGREVAELAGCRVLDASAVVAGHFGEIVADHADELLTREQVERLLDRVRSSAPTLAGEVVPGLLRAGELQHVLQNLVRERVSIRDLETVLETLAVHAGKTKDVDLLTEEVRKNLARQITETYRGTDSRLRVVILSRPLDTRLAAAGSQAEKRPTEVLGDDTSRRIIRAVAVAVGVLVENGYPPIILTSPGARAVLKDLSRADLPRLVVLSQREIPRDTPIEILGSVVEDEPVAVTTYTTTEAVT
jgi:flagellar biosynthesis protein FlhA